MSRKPRYIKSLFIFRRDLRIYDNRGLSKALEDSETVVPVFFLEDRYLDPGNSKLYRSNALQFIFESLTELNQKLSDAGSRLFIFKGELFDNLEKLIKDVKPDAIFLNEDYSPLSSSKDERTKNLCEKKGIDFHSVFDHLLTKPGSVLTQDETPYRVFTPFYKSALKMDVIKPDYNTGKNFYTDSLEGCYPAESLLELLEGENKRIAQSGGRKKAVSVLKNIQDFKDYSDKRDIPSEEGTTKLSAHLRFGTISVREFYWKVREHFGIGHSLIAELLWRDFYYHLGYFFPHVFKSSFLEKYDGVEWENDEDKFKAWCDGMTGFPIVDAGMRELNATGWMHNRLRMIVASFLTKDLHIDWRWGEDYFRKNLVDYDPFSNNGGWQWAASTGADAQPYFRIFNPWRQQERFDPEAIYIKKWVPELKDLDAGSIHKIYKNGLFREHDYPQPLVDHKVESKKAKEYYKEVV